MTAPEIPARVTFNNGNRQVGAAVVGHTTTNGTLVLDLLAAEGDSDDVKFFTGIPEGTGGLTFSR